jgi:hypothetical protein
MAMEFNSVREINLAICAARDGRLKGRYVYHKHFEDGKVKLTRISQARTRQGGLQVRFLHSSEWVDCTWSSIISQ